MPRQVTSSVRLNPVQLNRMLHGRTGAVGRVMAGFAGLSTASCKQVGRERITNRTNEYLDGISSTTRGTARGVEVLTTARAPHSRVLEEGSQAHVIEAINASVLRFEANGEVLFRKSVQHPGTQAYNILRDGVRRAGRQLSTIARG